MALLIDVTTFPQTFAAGTWPVSTLNTGRFRFTFTPTNASTNSTAFPDGNYWALVAAADNGGLWFHKSSGTMYIGYYNSSTGASIFEQPISFLGGVGITVDLDHVAATITISGADSGNGTFAFTPGGNGYSNVTLGVAIYGSGGFTWAGSISDIDNGVVGYTLAADPLTMAITPTTANLLKGSHIAANSNAVAVTTVAAGLLLSLRLVADAGAIPITTTDAALSYGSNDPYLQADPGTLPITTTDASLSATRRLTADATVLSISTIDAALVPNYPLTADAGSVGVSTTDASLRITRRLQADSSALAVSVIDAALTVSTAISIGDMDIDFQIFGLANRNASVTLDTQVTGSLVVIASGGRTSDVTQGVSDNKANSFNRINLQDYPDFPGYGVVLEYTRPPMTGGTTHTFNVPVTLFDENTTIAIEVIGVHRVAASSWRNVANASGAASLTSLPVTVDRPSMLVAFWFGSGPVFSPNTTPFQAVPDANWTAGPSYLVNNTNGEVQAASAYRLVTPSVATAYDVTWTQFPNQGAQLIVVALQSAATLGAESAAMPIVSTDATLARGHIMTADSLSITLDAQDATLRRGYAFTADPATFAVTPTVASLRAQRAILADSAALPVQSTDSFLGHIRALSAESGAMAILTTDAALLLSRRLDAQPISTAILVSDATLVKSGTPTAYTLDAESINISITTTDAALTAHWLLSATGDAMSITPIAAVLRKHWRLAANAGILALTSTQATLHWSGETILPEPALRVFAFTVETALPRTYNFTAILGS